MNKRQRKKRNKQEIIEFANSIYLVKKEIDQIIEIIKMNPQTIKLIIIGSNRTAEEKLKHLSIVDEIIRREIEKRIFS